MQYTIISNGPHRSLPMKTLGIAEIPMKSFAVNSSRDIFFVTRTEVASNCKLDAIVVPTEAKDKIITPLQDVWTQVPRQP